MGNNIFDKLTEKYPFITLCMYANAEYVGVVQNRDDVVTTIYDFGAVTDQQAKLLFLELANTWWWDGPACSLLDIVRRKGKRKSITLVRRLD